MEIFDVKISKDATLIGNREHIKANIDVVLDLYCELTKKRCRNIEFNIENRWWKGKFDTPDGKHYKLSRYMPIPELKIIYKQQGGELLDVCETIDELLSAIFDK